MAKALTGGVAVRGGTQMDSQPVSQRDKPASHGPQEENWPPNTSLFQRRNKYLKWRRRSPAGGNVIVL